MATDILEEVVFDDRGPVMHRTNIHA